MYFFTLVIKQNLLNEIQLIHVNQNKQKISLQSSISTKIVQNDVFKNEYNTNKNTEIHLNEKNNLYNSNISNTNTIKINNQSQNYTLIKDRTFFILNEKLNEEENKQIEFKNYSYPLSEKLREVIIKQICGFINSEGGRIYFGINDFGKVTGISLQSKEKDLFKNELVNLSNKFYPSCRTDKFNVSYIPIQNAGKWVKNLYVLKLIIKKGDNNKLYSISKDYYESFLRLDGQVVRLSSEEISSYIIKRANQLPIDDKNDFKDPEPEKIYESNFPEPSSISSFDFLKNDNSYNSKIIKSNESKIENNINSQISLKIEGIPSDFSTDAFLSMYFTDIFILSSKFMEDKYNPKFKWGYLNINKESDFDSVKKIIKTINSENGTEIKVKLK